MTEERIIIPEKIYVGLHKNAKGSFPHAGMTAWGTDGAAKGRMSTVDSWADNSVTMENQPQLGFVISGGSGKDEWLVIDPRGFSVSVKAEHMFDTLKHSTVINSRILEPCVWGRSRGYNVLLNTTSSTYERSVVITKIANSKTPWKSAQIGNRVTLVNGTQGIYMGKYYNVYLETRTARSTVPNHNKLKIDDSQLFVILKDQNVKHYKKGVNKEMLWINNPKLAVIDSTDQITREDAELQINELMADDTCASSFNSWYKTPFIASATAPDMKNLTLTLEDHEAGNLQSAIGSQTKCWVMLQSGEWGEHSYDRTKTVHTLTVYDHAALADNALVCVTKQVKQPHHLASQNPYTQVVESRFDLSQVKSHAQLKVSYVSSTGNTIHRLV